MPYNSISPMDGDSRSAIDLLKNSRMLSAIPSDLLESLTPFLKVKHFPQKTELVRKNEKEAEIYFLISGKIALYSNGNLILKLRRRGDMVGDMSFFSDKDCTTQEISDTSVELLSLNLSALFETNRDDEQQLKWIIHQLFTTMLVDKLTLCCTKAHEQDAMASQLKKLKALLTETRDKLGRVSKVKQDFLANISHEIRTPMHGVLGMTSLLLNTDLNEQQKEFALIIEKSASTFLAVINNILDFSKLGSGELELQNRPFALKKIVAKVIKDLTPKADEKNIRISSNISQYIPNLVTGDAIRIQQVLINLVGNAVKFTDVGAIKLIVDVISTHQNLVRVRFAVNDTGIGISEADKSQLFKSFSQVDTSLTRKYGGTGLGLVISKQLVEAMSGQIGFSSETGKGSTFWFTLDLATQPERRNLIGSGFPHHRKKTRQSDSINLLNLQEKKAKQILLVSDDKIDQIVVLLMLEKLGYSAEILNSARKLIEHLKDNYVDVIIIDSNTPDLDSADVIVEIRSNADNEQSQGIPIIALTSHVLDSNRSKFFTAGMNDYLSKPISIDDLDLIIQRWISTRKSADPEQPAKTAEAHCVDLHMIDRLRRDVGNLEPLIRLFLGEIPAKMNAIRQAIISSNAAELEKSAHTLKSNCITFGAMMMAETCFQLETIGSQGTVSGTEELNRLLDSQCCDVLTFFKDFLADT